MRKKKFLYQRFFYSCEKKIFMIENFFIVVRENFYSCERKFFIVVREIF